MKSYTVSDYRIDPPLSLHGLLGNFHRLPDEVRALSSDEVSGQSRSSLGGRVRFATDAGRINIKIHLRGDTTRCTADVYCGDERIAFHIHDDAEVGEDLKRICDFDADIPASLPSGSDGMRQILVNLPRNTDVERVIINLSDGDRIAAARTYTIAKPIVYYGSSLTAGACCVEPGHTYEARLSRLLDADYINLGFGGAARGELEIAQYIASLDMSAFVMDYTANAPDAAYLARTHKPFFDAIRQAHPDMPILLLSRPEFLCFNLETPRDPEILSLLAVVTQTYLDALRAGDERVWLLDGRLYYSPQEYTRYLCDDCVHPMDIGFSRYTQLIYPTLKAILHRCGFYPDEPVRVIRQVNEE